MPSLSVIRALPTTRALFALAAAGCALSQPLAARQRQQADTTRADSLRPVLLAPVVVSVTRAPTDPGRVPFAVAVIERREIVQGRPMLGLSEALVTIPGVHVADRQNPAQDDNLSIRGFGARSAFGVRGVKVLLDGIPQTLPDGQGQLSNVELADVRRVEILRGPSSSLYGNASGGVIALATDTAAPAVVEPTLRFEGGSYGMWKAYGALAAPLPRGDLVLDGTRLVSQGFRVHSEASTWRGSLRYQGALSARTRINVQLLAADSPRLQDPGGLTAAEKDTAPSAASPRNVTADAGKAVSQEQLGVGLKHSWASDASLDLSAFGVRRALDNATPATYIRLGRWAYGLRASTVQPLTLGPRSLVLTAGVDAQWQRDDRINQTLDRTTTTRDQLERVSEVGPFVEARVDPVGPATLTLGARYDDVAFRVDDRLLVDGDDSGSRRMAAPSASAGLTLDLAAALRPYLSVSTSFETPTTTELANRPTGPGGFNPDLQPQKAVNYEAGVRGQLAALGAYSLSAYRAEVRDELIPYEVPGDPARRFYRNAGSARHEGIEVGVTVHPVERLSIIGAYTYSTFRFVTFRTSTDTLDGKRIPGVPAHYGHASARYAWGGSLWSAVDVTASSGYYADDANTVRLDAWQTVALRAGWDGRVRTWRIAPFVAVQNLLDERYVGSVSVNALFGRYFEPAPGRNVYFGMAIRPVP